ncbi:MAG: hypothetical protein QG670_1177 [Thermoproteota archaeon]|nr:hypothetical protein [Thermoproteota archaeon]
MFSDIKLKGRTQYILNKKLGWQFLAIMIAV